MTARTSAGASLGVARLLALCGVGLLGAILLLPPSAAGLVATVPLAVAVLTGIAPLRFWAIGTASLMLPYFCYGVMRVITAPDERWAATGFTALTIAIFLLALDSMRRR